VRIGGQLGLSGESLGVKVGGSGVTLLDCHKLWHDVAALLKK
jgi:hypothetical protein